MAFMGFWGTGVEPGTQYTEKVSCTVWKMTMMMIHVHRLLQYNIIYTNIEKICRQCRKYMYVHVHCALLLAHRYLSALTTYFLNVGIYIYSIIGVIYLLCHLLCSPIDYLGLGEIA